jgi:hypothetical protein
MPLTKVRTTHDAAQWLLLRLLLLLKCEAFIDCTALTPGGSLAVCTFFRVDMGRGNVTPSKHTLPQLGRAQRMGGSRVVCCTDIKRLTKLHINTVPEAAQWHQATSS